MRRNQPRRGPHPTASDVSPEGRRLAARGNAGCLPSNVNPRPAKPRKRWTEPARFPIGAIEHQDPADPLHPEKALRVAVPCNRDGPLGASASCPRARRQARITARVRAGPLRGTDRLGRADGRRPPRGGLTGARERIDGAARASGSPANSRASAGRSPTTAASGQCTRLANPGRVRTAGGAASFERHVVQRTGAE